jgi:hypothetical protein
MSIFDSIFGENRKNKNTVAADGLLAVQFGHYSDNNKTTEQIAAWGEAERYFHEGKYISCAECFLKYVQDERIENVTIERIGNKLNFWLIQGSKKISGTCDDNWLNAWCALAKMNQSNVAAMRKLLDLNGELNYSRFSVQDNVIHIVMDCTKDMMHPNKLYFGLRELALQADKQDDLLVSSFEYMEQINEEHILQNSDAHKQIKFDFLVSSIEETVALADGLNPDTYGEPITYLYLNLLQKLDYLLVPQGQLQEAIEDISSDYWQAVSKKTTIALNHKLRNKLVQLALWPKEKVFEDLYYTKGAFCKVPPPDLTRINEVLRNCANRGFFHKEQGEMQIADAIMMYALSNAAYHNSLPAVLRSLVAIYMQVNHFEYCRALGVQTVLYQADNNSFNKQEINQRIQHAIALDKHRFPKLAIDVNKIKFTSLLEFNHSFLEALLNLDYNDQNDQ